MAARHLLIVDDSASITDALRILFEANGYRVSVAHSASAAKALQHEDPADVLLLDLTLPDGDGLEVLTAASTRNTGAAPVPALVITGHDDEAIRARCLAAGCRRVLVKPVPVAELLAQVRSIETARP